MEMIPITGITDEIRCVHCERINGILWDGPVPCCEFTFPSEKPSRAYLEWRGYCGTCGAPLELGTRFCARPCLGSVRWTVTRARARIARTREGSD